MNGDTQAIRDRLLAVLHHATRPLTTREVCDQAGPYHTLLAGRTDCDRMHRHLGAQLVACQPDGHIIAVSLYATNRGYVNLRALQRLDLVLKHWETGMRTVTWTAVGSATHEELEMLEELWNR